MTVFRARMASSCRQHTSLLLGTSSRNLPWQVDAMRLRLSTSLLLGSLVARSAAVTVTVNSKSSHAVPSTLCQSLRLLDVLTMFR